MAVTEIFISDPAALARRLADALASELQTAIAARGEALLAVSGGKSPIALFEQLRTRHLPWDKVTLILVDERVVPHDHADSNTALVRQHLLQERASAARFVPLFDTVPHTIDDLALDQLVASANQRLNLLPWPLDAAVLGMGEDGHTASLFPQAPGLHNALTSEDAVAWVRPASAPHARLTLTLSRLKSAQQLHLSIAGKAKIDVYQQAFAAPSEALPVSLLMHGEHAAPLCAWIA
jgi:6-phosphogluconolactonase